MAQDAASRGSTGLILDQGSTGPTWDRGETGQKGRTEGRKEEKEKDKEKKTQPFQLRRSGPPEDRPFVIHIHSRFDDPIPEIIFVSLCYSISFLDLWILSWVGMFTCQTPLPLSVRSAANRRLMRPANLCVLMEKIIVIKKGVSLENKAGVHGWAANFSKIKD